MVVLRKTYLLLLVCQYCHTESNNLKEEDVVHRLPELVCSLFCYPVYLTPFHCLKLFIMHSLFHFRSLFYRDGVWRRWIRVKM